jgi:hypothetical protein
MKHAKTQSAPQTSPLSGLGVFADSCRGGVLSIGEDYVFIIKTNP